MEDRLDRTLLDDVVDFERRIESAPVCYEDRDDSLLSLVLSGGKEQTKKHTRKRIRVGVRYGLLTVLKVADEGNPRLYRCRCKCGGKVDITCSDIRARKAADVGCAGEKCEAGDPASRMLFNPAYALKVQLLMLLSDRPGEVDNAWGGSAYEGLDVAPRDEGIRFFLSEVLPMVDSKSGWWLKRHNEFAPYAAYNIFLDRHPDPEVVKPPLKMVEFGGMTCSVRELSEIYGVSLAKTERLRRSTFSDNEFVTKLIEEAEK